MQDRITDQLHLMELETIGNRNKVSGWVPGAIAWYIGTARASTAWCKAFCKADPVKLLNRCLSGDLTDIGIIATATKYLRRYCGLKV